MRIVFASLFLMASCTAQSITVSGGNGSILVSGRAAPEAVNTVQDADKAAPVPPRENVSPVKQLPPVVSQPVKSETKPKRREWYLVSESWCKNCPAAKAVFLGKGWPETNILTTAECESRFGFRPPYVPFEFGEPERAFRPEPGIQTRLPVVNTRWGMIDLETYRRDNCNCPMCQGIRAMQQQFRQTSYEPPAAQQPTPDDVASETLRHLRLQPADVFADIGCGDGRILIAAVERYGVQKAIGIEIDPVMADHARQRVASVGLQDRIEIFTADATTFDFSGHGVTVSYCYLYPELLEKLSGLLAQFDRVGSPFHPVPGLDMEQIGDTWIYSRRVLVTADGGKTTQALLRTNRPNRFAFTQ